MIFWSKVLYETFTCLDCIFTVNLLLILMSLLFILSSLLAMWSPTRTEKLVSHNFRKGRTNYRPFFNWETASNPVLRRLCFRHGWLALWEQVQGRVGSTLEVPVTGLAIHYMMSLSPFVYLLLAILAVEYQCKLFTTLYIWWEESSAASECLLYCINILFYFGVQLDCKGFQNVKPSVKQQHYQKKPV